MPAPRCFGLSLKTSENTNAIAESCLALDTYTACNDRRSKHAPEGTLVLQNCKVLDVEQGTYSWPCNVYILEGKITRIDTSATTSDAVQGYHVKVDCEGKVLIPGLCDAHVHCTAVTANLSTLTTYPESYVTAKAAAILQGMLSRGFTTIRDAGGADWGLAQAVEEGTIVGPTLLFTGHALSQTGGHGDFRGRGDECLGCGAALRGIGRVCDGDAEVRRAARDELRKGAHCIKVMASGGVASPTDKLTDTQFSEHELRAIVEEAEACGTYVCAHAYTPAAIRRAVAAGVRSIEHGNYLDDETAAAMAAARVYLVPTLVTYQKILEEGRVAGMAAPLVAKVGSTLEEGLNSLQVAKKHSLRVCFGSDLLGDMHCHQSQEIALRSGAGLSALEILQQATVNCAALFGLSAVIGQVKVGRQADLLLLDGDPLEDVNLLTDAKTIILVVKKGLLAKVPYHGMQQANTALFET